MLKTLRTLIATAALAFVPVIAVPAVAHAQATVNTCLSQGSNLSLTDTGTCTPAPDQGTAGTKLGTILTTVINIFSIVVGIVAVVMIIFGGFKYITSGGESGNISGAKNTILYAIIGLVVVAFAQFIVKFVLNKVGP
ncbi:MAG TPA: pilin [Patescibacteria group bacterium]|nr:pilin [Patescibacteria group bacterium]